MELADSELPRGPRPIWVDCPENTSYVDILDFVSKLEAVKQYKEVAVIADGDDDGPGDEAEVWCSENEGWQYCCSNEYHGSEWQSCVVIDWVGPESLSRAANLLVLVTTERFVSECWQRRAQLTISVQERC